MSEKGNKKLKTKKIQGKKVDSSIKSEDVSNIQTSSKMKGDEISSQIKSDMESSSSSQQINSVKTENKDTRENNSSELKESNIRTSVKASSDESQNPDSSQTEESSKKQELEKIDDESEDEGIDDVNIDDLDPAARDALYERGVQYESEQKKKSALRCYLQCLKGLADVTKFSSLPKCLRKVADLYFEKEEFEKAIQFIQAEKMYYENALIDTSELESKLKVRKENQKTVDTSSVDPQAATPEVVRADEYENLARMCLNQKQPQLALEYQGKATKLRQQVYGEVHPVTAKSLDFFTVIYGEVGKQQYSESMEKVKTANDEKLGEDDNSSEKTAEESPQSILRRRKKKEADNGESKEEKKRVRFAEEQEKKKAEEWISHSLLFVLFVLLFVLLVAITFYVYCKVSPNSSPCVTWKSEVYYVYMRFKYMYHYYLASGTDQVVG